MFAEAIERPPSERTLFVAEACAHDECVRLEVESLLDSDRLADGFIETPAAALLANSAPDRLLEAELAAGMVLGPYEILGFLGSGGMSQVYRARDTRLGRIVAIKVMGGASSDPRADRRLQREAQHASRRELSTRQRTLSRLKYLLWIRHSSDSPHGIPIMHASWSCGSMAG